MKKSIISISFFVLIIILTGCSNKGEVYDGDGTKESPYQLTSVDDFNDIFTYDFNESDTYFELANDINFVESDTLYSNEREFKGILNGNGHTLTTDQYIFKTNNGTIENLGVEIYNETGDTTALADLNKGLIRNCYSTGEINSNEPYTTYVPQLGGLVNENKGTIDSSYSSVIIDVYIKGSLDTLVGGLVALNNGSILNSYSIGSISVDGSVKNHTNYTMAVGGLTGMNRGEIKSSYSAGTLSNNDSKIAPGGLTGFNLAKIENSFSTRDISSPTVILNPDDYMKMSYISYEDRIIIENSYSLYGHTLNNDFYDEGEVITVELLNSKEWYIDDLEWDQNIWDFDQIDGGYYPVHKTKEVASNLSLPTETFKGTNDNPIEISTIENLNNLSNNLYYKKHYVLMNDLNLDGVAFEPIGNTKNEFYGYFDGNNHTISNVTIEGKYQYAGLFGIVYGTVENLSIENIEINIPEIKINTDLDMGGLAGSFDGEINNVTVNELNLITPVVNAEVGGLVGSIHHYYSTLNIKNSSAEGDIFAPSSTVGGLVGEFNNSTMETSHSHVNINGDYSGGLIGDANTSTIINSFSNGDVYGSDASGGLIGKGYFLNINNSYSTSHVISDLYAGGLVGMLNSNTSTVDEYTIKNSLSIGDVTSDYIGSRFIGHLFDDHNLENAYLINTYCYENQELTVIDTSHDFSNNDLIASHDDLLNSLWYRNDLNFDELIWDLSNLTIDGPKLIPYQDHSEIND